jgi:ATP-binding cassette subfamily C protein
MMNQGKAQAIGPKDEILSKVLQRPLAIPRPLKIVPESGSAGA